MFLENDYLNYILAIAFDVLIYLRFYNNNT